MRHTLSLQLILSMRAPRQYQFSIQTAHGHGQLRFDRELVPEMLYKLFRQSSNPDNWKSSNVMPPDHPNQAATACNQGKTKFRDIERSRLHTFYFPGSVLLGSKISWAALAASSSDRTFSRLADDVKAMRDHECSRHLQN